MSYIALFPFQQQQTILHTTNSTLHLLGFPILICILNERHSIFLFKKNIDSKLHSITSMKPGVTKTSSFDLFTYIYNQKIQATNFSLRRMINKRFLLWLLVCNLWSGQLWYWICESTIIHKLTDSSALRRHIFYGLSVI